MPPRRGKKTGKPVKEETPDENSEHETEDEKEEEKPRRSRRLSSPSKPEPADTAKPPGAKKKPAARAPKAKKSAATPTEDDSEDDERDTEEKPAKSRAKAKKAAAGRGKKRQKVVADADSDSDADFVSGFRAIDRALALIYGNKLPPSVHYVTLIPWDFGGPDPLRGVSAYSVDAGADPIKEPAHWHYITYGFTELGEKNSPHPDVSGFGFELTFRLKKTPQEIKDEEAQLKKDGGKRYENQGVSYVPKWPVNMLQNLGRYVFNTRRTFDVGDHMNLNGPMCLNNKDTQIRAALFASDSRLPAEINSPNGKVKFIQLVGITEDEYELTWEWSSSGLIDFLNTINTMLITDLERTSMLDNPSTMAAIRAKIDAEGSKLGMLFSGVVSKWKKLGSGSNADDSSDDDDGHKFAAGAVGASAAPGASRGKTPSTPTLKRKQGGFLTAQVQKSSAAAQLLKGPRSAPTRGYKITLGAMIVRQLVRVLKYRLPYRRSMSVLGPREELITFVSADGLEEDDPANRDDRSHEDDEEEGAAEPVANTKGKGKKAASSSAKSKKPNLKKRRRDDDDDDEDSDEEDNEEKEKQKVLASKKSAAVREKKRAIEAEEDKAKPELKTNVLEVREKLVPDDQRPFLEITLSNDKVQEICSALKPVKGTYIFGEGDNTLMFVVRPTEIKSSDGDEVVETIGDI